MQKTIGIYHSRLCQIGGVETFLYNFCYNLKDYYDITVIYCNGDPIQINRLAKIVKIEQYDSKSKFEFDIIIRNSVWGIVPEKLFSKDNVYIEMRHANYYDLLKKGRLYQQYHKWNKINKIVACGDFVAKMSTKVLGDHPTAIKNILLPKQKTNKVLHLISCTRIDFEKGWGRMLQLCRMLKEHNIKFDWKIFTNNPQETNLPEVHFYPQSFDIFDYIADADYCVLLSDCEGLPYTVQEALQYDVPCIVTDIEGCTELIQDGVNGYVVPLDMKFDVTKLLNIPQFNNYNNHALEKWQEYLGNAEYKPYTENCIGYKVIATNLYQEKKLKDVTLGRIPAAGEEWIVPVDRAHMLAGNNKYKKPFVILKEKIYGEEYESI